MDRGLRSNHQMIMDRFVKTCEADERIVAVLLVGSYIKGEPDEHSDLDLYIITTEETHDDFVSKRGLFVELLSEPLFAEDFDIPNIVFLIFPDGLEVEIHYVSETRANHVFNEPFKVLVDKKNIMAGIVPEKQEPDQAKQTEKLRRLIYWFWHDFSHFVTAMGRNQLWWAHGQLDVLRSMCVGLARLKNDFSDPDVDEEVYFKIEKAMPVEMLSPLQGTFCPMEKEAMQKAGFVLIQFYKEHARSLAQAHGIAYPEELERVMIERLSKLR